MNRCINVIFHKTLTHDNGILEVVTLPRHERHFQVAPQRQLAALLHMPQPQYNRYEQGLRDLPTTTLIALADIYHTSTDYLLGRTNDPKPPVSL